MKAKKIIIAIVIFILSLLIFTFLDIGMDLESQTQLIQPVLFSIVTVCVILFVKSRLFILKTSLILIVGLVVFYLLNLIEISEWVGRLGLGSLIIVILSYMPDLLKKGYIEKF